MPQPTLARIGGGVQVGRPSSEAAHRRFIRRTNGHVVRVAGWIGKTVPGCAAVAGRVEIEELTACGLVRVLHQSPSLSCINKGDLHAGRRREMDLGPRGTPVDRPVQLPSRRGEAYGHEAVGTVEQLTRELSEAWR